MCQRDYEEMATLTQEQTNNANDHEAHMVRNEGKIDDLGGYEDAPIAEDGRDVYSLNAGVRFLWDALEHGHAREERADSKRGEHGLVEWARRTGCG